MKPFEHKIKAMDPLPRKMYPHLKFLVQFWEEVRGPCRVSLGPKSRTTVLNKAPVTSHLASFWFSTADSQLRLLAGDRRKLGLTPKPVNWVSQQIHTEGQTWMGEPNDPLNTHTVTPCPSLHNQNNVQQCWKRLNFMGNLCKCHSKMDTFGKPLVQRQSLRKPSRQKKTVRKRDIGKGAKGQIPELVT